GFSGQSLKAIFQAKIGLYGAVVQVAPNALALSRCCLALKLLQQITSLKQWQRLAHHVMQPPKVSRIKCRTISTQTEVAQRLAIAHQWQGNRLCDVGVKRQHRDVAQSVPGPRVQIE